MTTLSGQSGAYGKPEDLADELKFVQHEFTDAELQSKLEEAQREVDEIIGKHFEEEIKIKSMTQTSYDLAYRQLYKVSKIVLNGREEVDEENYEIDHDNGVIHFDEDFIDNQSFMHPRQRHRDFMYVLYVPMKFADLERFIAAKNILDSNIIQTSDEAVDQKLESLDNKIEILSNRVQDMQVSCMVDHKRRKTNQKRRMI